MIKKLGQPLRTGLLTRGWYLFLAIVLVVGVLLLIVSGPFCPSWMPPQVRSDGWGRLFGIIMISGVLSHVLIAYVLRRLDDWFELVDRNPPPKNLLPPASLGLCESVLYPSAWILGHAEFIGVWLALKVVGDWPRWGTHGEDPDALDEGRRRYTRFLIGNALMLMAGAVTYGFVNVCVPVIP
jgi:hypothetical protein